MWNMMMMDVKHDPQMAVGKEQSKQEYVNDIFYSYEIRRCSHFIFEGNYKRIALQFSDDLLPDAEKVVLIIKGETMADVFILADTSYGSCCVDEVAAEHMGADCIIHFGNSCLSLSTYFPVLYIFGKMECDVVDCCEAFMKYVEEKTANIILMSDTRYNYCVHDIFSKLKTHYCNIILSSLLTVSARNSKKFMDNNIECVCNRMMKLFDNTTLDSYVIFYIGDESRTLTNLMMTCNQNSFYTYNPLTKEGRKENSHINKALMKRYYMVERVKDAQIVGIVVGALTLEKTMNIINKIKKLLKYAGKKYYTFVVGKINAAKLGNFLEVDIFVLVSCLENTFVDSKEFHKPIVTPFELEIACNPSHEWDGSYLTDFSQLLPGSSKFIPLPTDKNTSTADVSLITNSLRPFKALHGPNSLTGRTMSKRDGNTVTRYHSAGEFLTDRSWRGLEQELGKTLVSKATIGRKGIAMKYDVSPSET